MDNSALIKLNSKAIYVDHHPQFLLSVDFDFYHIMPNKWKKELRNLKTSGINCINLNVKWQEHNKRKGKMNFHSENKNIQKLIKYCTELNLWVHIRIISNPIPNWLLIEVPEIMNKNQKQTKNSIFLNNSPHKTDRSFMAKYNFNHPAFQKSFFFWVKRVAAEIENFQYPDGNVILIQIFKFRLTNIKDPYFSWGISSYTLNKYQNWLKQKFLLIEAINAYYDTNYSSFSEIEFPPILKNQDSSIKPSYLLQYLNWMEFKENLLESFISKLSNKIFEFGIKVPQIINIDTYKSPINFPKWRKNKKIQINQISLAMSYQFSPAVFMSPVNEHCYVNWHSEWLKTNEDFPAFIGDFQAHTFTPNYNWVDFHNLLRLSLIHGIKAFSLRMPNMEEKSIGFLNQKRFEMFKNFAQVVQANKKIIQSATKTYDQLTVAYYHPVTWLKSFAYPITTKNFAFPIDYATLKSYYKFILQLLAKNFIHYSVVDLQELPLSELIKKPFLLLYYLGWMDHNTMKKLVNYVENGGVILSFGDIPKKNEIFEEDHTLYELYLAKCLKETDNVHDCYWNPPQSIFKIENIRHLYEYKLDIRENVRILAHEGDFEKIFAFSREYKKGKILHSGLMVEPNDKAMQYLVALFEEIGIPTKSVSASQECVASQIISPNEERLLLIGNLTEEEKHNVSFSFYNRNAKAFPAYLDIDEVFLAPKLCQIWHAFVKITKEIIIKFSSVEIVNFSRNKIKGRFTTLNSQKKYQQKIILLINQKNLDIKKINGNVNIISQKSEDLINFKEMCILFHGNIKFLIEFDTEQIEFEIKKYSLNVKQQ